MSRGISDLLSTSSDMTAAVIFLRIFSDCLSADRLHVDCHVGLLRQVVIWQTRNFEFKKNKNVTVSRINSKKRCKNVTVLTY